MAQNCSTTGNTDLDKHDRFVSKNFDGRWAPVDMIMKMEQLQKEKRNTGAFSTAPFNFEYSNLLCSFQQNNSAPSFGSFT